MKNLKWIMALCLALCLGMNRVEARTGGVEAVAGDTVYMTWKVRAGETKTFEFRGNEETAFIVDWGDGDTNVYVGRGAGENLKAAHTYQKAGDIDVRIYSEANWLEVVSWGLARYTERAFGMELEMVAVDGGTFEMGATEEQGTDAYDSEKPVHSVALSSFYIGKYEVTQAQWKAVMGTSISQQRDKYSLIADLHGIGDNYPMYYVSWEEAVEFCKKLSAMTGRTYRLPTEAEWEYAARGGQAADGTKYAGSNNIDEVAWYYNNSSGLGESHRDYGTHPVGKKWSNGLGLYDMSGNVTEWCSDRYDSAYYSYSPAVNLQGPSSGFYRVRRGGSWGHVAQNCRVSYRGSGAPGSRFGSLGFRVVCEP